MQFKKIREPLLIALGVLLTVLLIWLCIALTLFLGKILNASLLFEQRPARSGEFDTATFERLNLVQEQRLGTVPPQQIVVPSVPQQIPTTSTATSSNTQ